MKIIKFDAKNVYGIFNYRITFHSDITILHGINGCGKSTTLMLINYIIGGNYRKLNEIRFKSLRLEFQISKKEFYLEINQQPKERENKFVNTTTTNHPDLKKNFNSKGNLKDDFDSSIFTAIFNPIFLSIDRKVQSENYLPQYHIKTTRNFTELSYQGRKIRLHRHAPPTESIHQLQKYLELSLDEAEKILEEIYEKRDFRSRTNRSIIKDIADIISIQRQQYSRFCSKLDGEYKSESFANMISVFNYEQIMDKFESLDQNELDKRIKRIFDQRGVFIPDIPFPDEEELNYLSDNLTNEKDYFKSNNEIHSQYLVIFIQYMKLDGTASLLEINNIKKDEKELPFKLLVQSLNDFYKITGKSAYFTDDDMLRFEVSNEYGTIDIGLNELTSGEKQILILFTHLIFSSESEDESIMLYDEPELSLHMDWQSIFIETILKLRPKIQIIFATHSPTIGASYLKNHIKMGVISNNVNSNKSKSINI